MFSPDRFPEILERAMRPRYLVAAATSLALAGAAAWGAASLPATAASRPAGGDARGIHKIKHVVVIMQENRSFDSFFGTYPGAAGIPMKDGVPTVCVPDPRTGTCVKPYVDHADSNAGGPHMDPNSRADTDHGKMDGFIAQAQQAETASGRCKKTGPCPTDVMGYHTGSDIPNYWDYARNFVLQDHMYEDVHSWSFPMHLYMTSGWSADCKVPSDPMSCVSTDEPVNRSPSDPTPFAWTDLTYLLHKNHVSWGYYLDHGAQGTGNPGVPPIWNPLPGFSDVHQDGQLNNVTDLSLFYAQAKAGTLPSVSWIVPDGKDSQHPPALLSTGQAYTTNIINAIMRSKDWDSTAIFLAWDDWGGFYDNVNPEYVDSEGYGIRVAAMMISPYARRGYIDPQTLSPDAYLKFIEDDFLYGQRLNPKTDGRPDSRPDVRENAKVLGNLLSEFNFRQRPRPPVILNPCPARTTLTPHPAAGCGGVPAGGLPAGADGD